MKKMSLGLGLGATIAFGMTGCGEMGAAPRPLSSVEHEEIYSTGQTARIELGGVAFLGVIDADSDAAKNIRAESELISHQYAHGSRDANAPIINDNPIRVNVSVALGGEVPTLSNDAACDALQIQGAPQYIVGLALGGKPNGVMISWPNEEPNSLYVCSFQEMAPHKLDGVVLFATDQER